MNHIIKKYLRIYLYFWKVAVKLSILYRADSVMMLLAVILLIGTNILFFGSIFRVVPTLGGWSFFELIFLMGVYDFNFGIFKMLYGRTMEDVIDKIFDGSFDYYLLKPMSARFLSYFLPPLFKSIPSFILSVGFMFYGMNKLGISLDWHFVFILGFYSLVSQIIAISFFQIAISLSFFTGRADEIWSIFENAWFYSRYPRDVFTGNVLAFLTYIVPISLFASYPAAIIIGKIQPTILNLIFPFLIAIGLFILSNGFYKYGIRNYSSASS